MNSVDKSKFVYSGRRFCLQKAETKTYCKAVTLTCDNPNQFDGFNREKWHSRLTCDPSTFEANLRKGCYFFIK